MEIFEKFKKNDYVKLKNDLIIQLTSEPFYHDAWNIVVVKYKDKIFDTTGLIPYSVLLDVGTCINNENLKNEFLKNYRKSGMYDINDVEIKEGDIINADGYNSDLEEMYFHVVEFYEGQFGSNVYSDFEPLSSYEKIEVVGHVEDFRDKKCSGNIGEVLK